MTLLFSAVSLVIGLYFWRTNLVLSIIISFIYLGFLFFRFNKRKFVLFLSIFLIGVVIPRIEIKNNSTTYYGVVVEAKDNYIILNSKLTKYYISSEDNNFEMGDYLIVEGETSKLKLTSYESRFNFESYLKNKGVDYEIKVNSIDSKIKSPIKIHAFKNRFLSNFDENTASLISAFLFNDKDYSTNPIKNANSNGIVYLFSLSGIYLQALFSILSYLLLIKFSEKTAKILPFIILLPYAFFSFTKIGTLRVYGLYLLKYYNQFYAKRKLKHIELVSLLAMFFLIIDYHLVYQEAFYIGFSLSLLSPFMHNATKCVDKKKRKLIYVLLLRLFILPIQISSGHLDILVFVKQLIIFPINFLFLLITMLSVIIPIYRFTNLSGNALTWILEKMDLFSLKVPFSSWCGATPIIFIAIFLLVIYFLESVQMNRCYLSLCFVASIIFLSIVPLQDPIMNSVHFVNVGQGDAIIIKNRNHTVMIDTGGQKNFDIATECLIPFMDKHKITHIDALITTHDDFDHSGGVESLINNFKVKTYLNSADQFPYQIGDIKLTNLNNFYFDDDNDKSLVLYMEFMKKKFLFMGDASTKVEKELISAYDDLDCDILKIGHHGSKTSSCFEFLDKVSPKEAIVSVGAKNYYNHPNEEVIERLNYLGIKIRRTDEEGTISYYSLLT